jgi:hypothetical protein
MANAIVPTYKANATASIEAICDYMDKHGKVPSVTDKSPKVRKLAYKLGNLRQAKAGHIPNAKFHRSYDILATSRGYKGLFNPNYSFSRQ